MSSYVIKHHRYLGDAAKRLTLEDYKIINVDLLLSSRRFPSSTLTTAFVLKLSALLKKHSAYWFTTGAIFYN